MMCGLQGAGQNHTLRQAGQALFERGAPPPAGGLRHLPPRRNRPALHRGRPGGRAGVQAEGEKPEAIAAKAVAHAKDYGNDIVILDTAGRLHVDEALMEELHAHQAGRHGG